jgi:ABC-type lipoprotein release transport system permease subunit
MLNLFKLAYRDLLRNRRRSLFSALALGMGIGLLLMIAATVEGEMRGSLESSINLQTGHLQIRAKDYNPDKNSLAWEDLVDDPDRIASQISMVTGVKIATPRLISSGIVNFGDKTNGVAVLGIDPGSVANAPFRSGLSEGDFIGSDDRDSILIGKELAKKMGISLHDNIQLLVNTSDGSVNEQSFNVKGIFNSGVPAYDETTTFLPLSKAQAITGVEKRASTILVLLNDREMTDVVAASLKSDKYSIVTWKEQNEMVVQTEEFAHGYMVIINLIVLAITATVIVNTLVMAVFERTREIGILSAIGMKSTRIMGMFIIESFLLALLGTLIGFIIGGVLVWYSTNVGFYIGNMGIRSGFLLGERIYGYLTMQDTVSLTITAFVVTMLAALYPAILAARMEPVKALHGGE